MTQAKLFPEENRQNKFLNVGGGPRNTMPQLYKDWDCIWLDIDPDVNPDIVCDARELSTLEREQFDAIYCSHNLEHYYQHDGLKVLQGFLHVLKDDGFAHIIVPDIQEVMRKTIQDNLDISDVLYQSAMGPIKVRDVLYGYESQIAASGNDYYAHKTGFSAKSLKEFLHQAGFPFAGVGINKQSYEIIGVGFKKEPNQKQKDFLNL
jgi:ubiquinone/menaquinone biosynthesis C-methylase UbiE